MDNYNDLPQKIKNHLDVLTKASGLPYNNESKNLIAKNWIDKEDLFTKQIESLEMIQINNFEKEDIRPFLLLTYSGSLISGTSLENDSRHIEYYSIKLRSDVPEIVIIDGCNFTDNINIDQEAIFTKGAIKKTSSLYKIAVCDESVNLEEQNKRIREAVIFLTNGFVKINKTLFFKTGEVPDQFTMKSIVKFLALKNNLTQKQIKQILEDYLYMIECGMLLKERVPIGRLGKLFIKVKPPQKARVGINPSSGEKITINAKPEMFVPKINFSKIIKEKAGSIKIDEEK